MPVWLGGNEHGFKRVVDDAGIGCRVLFHANTEHGRQAFDPALAREAAGYLRREGPLGDMMALPFGPGARFGCIGLGVGAFAAHVREGQHVAFYELDPQVVAAATDLFSYLASCRGTVDVRVGDGLALVAAEPDASLDLLVVDAFASDDVPAHLVSAEALRCYARKLTARGVLVFHVTSTHTDLEAPLGALAGGLHAVARREAFDAAEERRSGRLTCHLVALARRAADADFLRARGWHDVPAA